MPDEPVSPLPELIEPSTYTVADGGTSITCHACGTTSRLPQDVANLYCGRCHRFHAEHPWRGRTSVQRVDLDSAPRVGGYLVDYSQPSEKALNAVDPEMKAFIARSKIISVEGDAP